jgi:hypothetical protein
VWFISDRIERIKEETVTNGEEVFIITSFLKIP